MLKIEVKRRKINRLLAPAMRALGFELLGCEISNRGKRKLLRVYIEKPTGINIDDCSIASRQISALLDVENILLEPYDLEVSSPGSDRPLFSLVHYKAVIGQCVHVRLQEGEAENRRNYTGVLQTVEDEMLSIAVDGETYKIPYAKVERGHVVPRPSKY